MRALFLTTSFPPLPESQTIRNVYLLRGLVRAGFTVDVVAPSGNGGDPTLERLLPLGAMTVHRTASPIYDRVIGHLGRSRMPGAGAFRSLVGRAAGYLMSPDVRADWTRAALRAARRLPRPDVIVSSSGSNTAHVAASRLATELGVHWVADFGDPWSHNPIAPASLPHIRLRNRRMERRALAACSAVTVTTEPTAQLYRRLDARQLPVHVVPCGFTPMAKPTDLAGRAPRRIVYAGSASTGTRDLRSFLRALAEVCARRPGELQLDIIGASSPAFVAEATRLKLDNVRFSGWVPYEESLRLMTEADLLLLVGNATGLQVPGKVFNYAASGRPILYIGQLPEAEDPTYLLLRDWPGVRYAKVDDAGMARSLSRLLGELPSLAADAARRVADPRLARYEWDRIGDEFAGIVRAHATSDT